MKLKQIILSLFLSFSIALALSISDLNEIRGDNPTPYELNSYILKKCKEKNVPPIIVKAILLREGAINYKWQQYQNGIIVSHNDYSDSYGLGLFQITCKLNTANENEVRKIVSDWKYNVDKAVDILLINWGKNIQGMSGVDVNPLIIENWYYPIAWYNGGGAAAKKYVDKIYDFMRNKSEVGRFLEGSANYDTILNYYKVISSISSPYDIPTFRGDPISVNNPQVYTLQQILNNGGELHVWDKASNSYNNYEENHNLEESLTPNMNNKGYKKPLNPFSLEQCTAFVWGRAYEKKGIKIKFSVTRGRDAKNWLKYVTELKQGNTIRANSIVVWGGDFHKKADGTYKNAYGHVAFIEKIENNYVYFNEANVKTFTTGGGYDGHVKKMTLDKFKKYRSYAGDILGYIYLSSEEISSTDSGIFDGAGSLVSPNEQCWGCDKDEARMHPHPGTGSTVVFQWLYNSDTCSQIDLVADSDIEVVVKAKAWDEHLTQKAFKTTLGTNPVTLKRPSDNRWTTLAITSTNSINHMTPIYAYCKTPSDTYHRGNSESIDKDLVDVTYDYFWTGTGSLITQADAREFDNAGIGIDYATTFKTKNSLTSFQWYASSKCSKVKIKGYNESSSSVNGVYIKGWAEENWSSNKCSSLPCTIEAPSTDAYYIIKVKSSPNAIKSGYLETSCIE